MAQRHLLVLQAAEPGLPRVRHTLALGAINLRRQRIAAVAHVAVRFHQPGFDQMRQRSSGLRGVALNMMRQVVGAEPFLLAQDRKRDQAVDGQRSAELGFLRLLRGHSDHWEVRRILKAYVDAQTLADFASKLREYAGTVASDG